MPDLTDLAVGAHPDDVEIFAAGPIVECRNDAARSFGAVIVTDGRRSPRGGEFAGLTDDALARVRHEEQRAAAALGGYAALVQLGHRSQEVLADPGTLVDELQEILRATRPAVLYTHEPGDAHATHVAVCEAVLTACRRLDPDVRPARVLGCEGWRGLDAIPGAERADLEWAADVGLEHALLAAHSSQVDGGPVDIDAELSKRRLRPGRHRTRAVELTHRLR